MNQNSKIKLIFKYSNGESKIIECNVGDNILALSRQYDLRIEGACGGVLACATCHVVVSDPWFDKLPKVTLQEDRMLDNAQELELNSRLCCQINVTSDMHGMIISVPESTEGDGHEH